MNPLTKELAIEFLSYDDETGHLTWIKKASYKTEVGSRAGWRRSLNGYRQIGFLGGTYYEHRVIWLIKFGTMPKYQIDHRNGIKDDNRFSNLREASSTLNLANIGAKRDNTSGVKNVHWCNTKQRWVAKVKSKGRTLYVGSFFEFAEAEGAAKAARIQVFGDFASQLGHERDAAMCAWQYRGAK